MRVVELKGTSHVYTLKDGSTFRIFARKTADVDDNLISDEMLRAEKLRILRFIKSSKSTHTNGSVGVLPLIEDSAPTTKKSATTKKKDEGEK